MESVLALMIYPKGFGCNDLKEKMQKKGYKDYSTNNARYDMQKLKGKKFVDKIKGKQKNKATKQGIQIMSAALCVWKQELKPFLTIVNKKEIDENSKELNAIESHFFNARMEIQSISNLYGIKIAG
jgi:repressor of nif and glnA expression